MPNSKNIQTVNDISQKVQKASSIVFFEYKGLGSNAVNELRKAVKDLSSEVLIAKNTLVKLALQEKKAQEEDLQGQTGVLFSFEDGIASIKDLFNFSKKHEAMKVKGAFIDGVYYNSDKVKEFSTLPSKLEIVTRLMASFKSPLFGFNNVLAGTRNKFVYAISAVAKQKEVGD